VNDKSLDHRGSDAAQLMFKPTILRAARRSTFSQQFCRH